MGIGVSYTGSDGRTRRFTQDGLPEDGSDLARIAQGVPSISSQMRKNTLQDLQKRLQDASQKKTVEDASVMPGGSVRRGIGGLCLAGEEQSPLVEGTKVFGSANGRKGFLSLDEIDPPSSGTVLGKEMGGEPSDAHRDGRGNGGWSFPISRTWAEIIADPVKKSNKVTIWNLVSTVTVSPNGMIVGKSAERKVPVVSFYVTGDGGGEGSGDYCVKPIFMNEVDGKPDPSKPIELVALMFGTKDEIEGGGAVIINTTTCPYGSE